MHLPVARVTNLSRAMEEMKEAGYWLVGLDERAKQLHTEVDLNYRWELSWGAKARDCTTWSANGAIFSSRFPPRDRSAH